MNQTDKKAELETEMLMARGMSAATSIGKSAELATLIAEHGGKDNVPEEKLVEWLGPMDEVAKSIRMITALQNLCNRFQLPLMQIKTSQAVGLFVNARLTEPDLYDIVKDLHDGPDDKVRRGVYQLMLRLGDLNQRKVDLELANPEKKAAFEAWLDGDLSVRDEYDPKGDETY